MGYISITVAYKLLKNLPYATQGAKFLLVGGAGFVIEAVLMVIFVDGLGFEKLPFYAFTNALLFMLNFILTDIFVFRDQRQNEPLLVRRFRSFVFVKGTGLALNMLAFELTTLLGASTILATIVGSGVGMVFNFAGSVLYTYGKKKEKEEGKEESLQK